MTDNSSLISKIKDIYDKSNLNDYEEIKLYLKNFTGEK